MNAPLSFANGRTRLDPSLVVCEETSTYRRSSDPETTSDWAEVHACLGELARARSVHERDVCRWLLAAERLGAHARAGYASIREYADRLLGLTPRQTEERL